MDYQEHRARIKRLKLGHDWDHMRVLPVSFAVHGTEMLGHAKLMIDRQRVAIHPKFTKLITALRTATAREMKLNKEKTKYDDTFDAFILALRYFGIP